MFSGSSLLPANGRAGLVVSGVSAAPQRGDPVRTGAPSGGVAGAPVRELGLFVCVCVHFVDE
jgi:hypothetical protein